MFFKCNISVKARDRVHGMTLIEHYAHLPIACYRLTNIISKNAFTYSVITGNISNSLKIKIK